MTVKFYKYQGTGNDFILFDNREARLNLDTNKIALLCNRRFGVGADGLMYLQRKDGYDFEMVYFNSDGNQSTMCGNGGRCLIQFAYSLGYTAKQCKFMAVDGKHYGEILDNGIVSLKMNDVADIENLENDYILNTGSPHYVQFVKEASSLPIIELAHKIRYGNRFAKDGINVNFVEVKSANEIYVRTYERGVENETLSCGTGVVASSLAYALKSDAHLSQINVETPGGKLIVQFKKVDKGFSNIYLIGPAQKVFEGSIEI